MARGSERRSTAVAQREDGEGRKEHILRVAAELFAAKGYNATGVQELSDAIGLGRGALYHHIKSKEMLLYEISIKLLRDILVGAEEIVDSDRPADEKLRQLARQLLSDIARNRIGWTVSLQELRGLEPEHREEVIAARDSYEQLWAAVFSQGAEEGVMVEVSPTLRRGLLGLFNSSHRWIREEGEEDPQAIADEYIDVLLEGIRIPDEGGR